MRPLRRTVIAGLLGAAAALGAASAASAADPAPGTGTGRVVVEWEKVQKKARPAARALRSSRAIERVAAIVNKRIALPRDLPIYITGELDLGPAYLPDLKLDDGSVQSFIVFPGSFLIDEMSMLKRYLRGEALKPRTAMIWANQFVTAHELGHALVHQLDLPVTGKEEDAVDGFAAYLLTNDKRFGIKPALGATLLFDAMASTPTERDYADEHSLTQQRVYQFLCWIYGSAPKQNRDLLGKGGLPRARAVRCRDEWRQLNRSWDRLLAPHLKNAA